MLDASVRKLAAQPLDGAAEALDKSGVSPNTMTVIGFVIGLLGAAAIADGYFIAGLAILFFNRLADMLDGALARRRGPTPLGGFLDTTLDLIVYSTIPFAFALEHGQNGLASAFLLLALIIAFVPGLAARAFGSTAPDFVLCGHSETFLVFAVMCLVPWAFSPLAYIYGFFCFVSGGISIASTVAHLGLTAKS